MKTTVVYRLKTNKHIRSLIQTLLSRYKTSRPYRNVIDARLYFLAGRHLNNLFSRYAEQEPVIAQNIQQFIKPDSTIFDIGANIGYYTVMFAKLAPKGVVVSIEPDKHNLLWLKKNIVNNDLRNVVVIDKAMSNVVGLVEFFIDKNTGRTSSVMESVFHPDGRYMLEKTTVNSITCDTLLENNTPDLIKCDIEGNEVAFLQGATKTLSRHPVIMMEVKKENRENVVKILVDSGYSMYNAEKPLNSNSIPLMNIESENIFALPNGCKIPG
jgi:FkbM family methyltransferase